MSQDTKDTPPLYKVAEGLFFGKIYWIMGDLPTNSRQRNEVKSPPVSGWSHALLIDKGGKMVTVFCPYTLESFQISRQSSEMQSMSMDLEYAVDPKHPLSKKPVGYSQWTETRQEGLLQCVRDNWAMVMRLSLTGRDFDTAALVLQMLGAPVPLRTIQEGAEPDKPRGGKEADVLGLLKPVKPESKRGQILAFFLPQARSIREAMAEFGFTRSNVLSHLFILQKEHGIGYCLTGDAAVITLPEGCTNPFAEGQ